MHSLCVMTNTRLHWGNGRDSFLCMDRDVLGGKTGFDKIKVHQVLRGNHGATFSATEPYQCRRVLPKRNARRCESHDLMCSSSILDDSPENAARGVYQWSNGLTTTRSQSQGSPSRKKPPIQADVRALTQSASFTGSSMSRAQTSPAGTQYISNYLDGFPAAPSPQGGLRWMNRPESASDSPGSPSASLRGMRGSSDRATASSPGFVRGKEQARQEVVDRWLRDSSPSESYRENRGRCGGSPTANTFAYLKQQEARRSSASFEETEF